MISKLKKKCFWAALSLSLLSSPITQAEDELSLIFKTVENTPSETAQVNMLKGVLAGLQGLKDVEVPDSWKTLKAKFQKSDNSELKKVAQQLSRLFGSEEAFQEALALTFNKDAKLKARQQALKSLSTNKYKELLPRLVELFGSELEKVAIRALSFYNNSSIPKVLMSHYKDFDIASRQAVIETLATRKIFALEIIKGLKSKAIKKNEVPAYTARNLKNLLGKRFTAVYGEIQEVSGDKSKLIAKYKAKLNSAAFSKADAFRGRKVYERTCAACHKMFDKGGIIGPDLTGSNRADQDYILLNIIDPSFDVPLAYRTITITKNDGQVLVGNIVAETAATIELKMVAAKVIIAKNDIASKTVSKVSMMPEGLLSTLNDTEFMDLIKYLQAEKQVEAK
ncbi:MAG: c-type cytochrome [Lentisphaerales bacterium]|nr:c-type cytochrome [Lentisphaerales bacterium]